MEIPFSIIVETEFVNAAPGSGVASFFLSQPPLFYLEDIAPDPAGGPPLRTWKRCADWTEGMQATKILRHDLVGSAVQLAYVLRNFQAAAGSDIRLRCPPYVRSEFPSAHASMDHHHAGSVPPLPPSLAGDAQGYRPPFGSGALDSGRDRLSVDVPKRYSLSPSGIGGGGLHVPLSAPADATTYGDPLGSSSHSHSHLGPTDGPSSSPPNTFSSSFPLSAASSSSGYSTVSLYPIEVPVQRPQSHLGHYAAHVPAAAAVAAAATQSPYIGQGHGFSIPAPPASAPPSHSHFELAPTTSQQQQQQRHPLAQQPSYRQQQQQQQQQHQQQQRQHQTSQMLGPPSVPVPLPLPFGNGFDTSGQRGE